MHWPYIINVYLLLVLQTWHWCSILHHHITEEMSLNGFLAEWIFVDSCNIVFLSMKTVSKTVSRLVTAKLVLRFMTSVHVNYRRILLIILVNKTALSQSTVPLQPMKFPDFKWNNTILDNCKSLIVFWLDHSWNITAPSTFRHSQMSSER